VERWRDRQGGTGREIQARGGGDTGEIFDDLDYFLLLRGYPQRYMPLLDFKDGRLRAGRMSLRVVTELLYETAMDKFAAL
jgi:hypothetical protein